MSKTTKFDYTEYNSADTGHRTMSLSIEVEAELPYEMLRKLAGAFVFARALFDKDDFSEEDMKALIHYLTT